MHSVESRRVTGPSNMLFSGVYVSTSQPRNLTGWSSEGVKQVHQICQSLCIVLALRKMTPHLRQIRESEGSSRLLSAVNVD